MADELETSLARTPTGERSSASPPIPPRQPVASGAGSGRSGGMPRWLLFGGLGAIVIAVIAIVVAMAVGGSPGSGSVPVAVVAPTETPAPTETLAPTQPPAPTETLAPTETSEPTPTSTPMPTYTPYPSPLSHPCQRILRTQRPPQDRLIRPGLSLQPG